MSLWVHKYKPKRMDEIPHPVAMSQLKDFVTKYHKQRKKAVLLYGQPGIGKSAAVYALAAELGLELIEVNASDFRDSEQIQIKIGNAAKQQSLFGTNKIILIDEIDGISGEDKGGIGALSKVIDESSFPIIFTANNPWNKKLGELRKKSFMIEFKPPHALEVYKLLQKICNAENVKVTNDVLKMLAHRSGGDIRAAITDAQVLASSKEITPQQINSLSERNRVESVLTALTKILKSTDLEIARHALDNLEEDLDEIFLWLDENLPKEYKSPEELARAYEVLSKADVFRGRIIRRQYWRHLAHINALLSAGVAVAKDKKPSGFVPYSRSLLLVKKWQANQKFVHRNSIAEKIAAKTHTSRKKTLREIMPYLKQIAKSKSFAKALAIEFKLSEEESDWLKA